MASAPTPAVPPSTSSQLPSIVECLFGERRKCPKLRPQPKKEDNNNSTITGTATSDDDDEEATADTGIDPSQPTTTADADAATDDPSQPTTTTTTLEHEEETKKKKEDNKNDHSIDLGKLRRICALGIADEGSYRGVAWRVLLGYLDTDNIHTNWKAKIPNQREAYAALVQQYMEGPLERGKDLRGQLSKLLRDRKLRRKYNRLSSLDKDDSYHCEDGSNNNNNNGNTSDGDDSVMSEPTIESAVSSRVFTSANKIVDRLPLPYQEAWKKSGIDLDHKNSDFTSQMVSLGINQLKISSQNENDSMTEEQFQTFVEDAKLLGEIRKDVARTHPDLFFYLEPKDHLGMRRYGALERILFIWAKLNKGVRYVQGMNEIIGTIYYVLANDHNSEWANHAEADSYYLFHALMMDMKDVFVPDMDDTNTGIQGRIANLQRLLQTHDPEVYEHLQEVGIDASFFAIRWLTTLLSREFLLPDTIRLWDSMFSSTHKENFLRYVCGTMVMTVRDDLLRGDFGQCLRLLQSYPPGDVDSILVSSRSLWIYESQITLACHRGGVSLHQALQSISPPSNRSLIMAFGMRGGIAPRMTNDDDDDENSPTRNNNNSNSIKSSNSGLFGRVKRFWSNSQKDAAEIHQESQPSMLPSSELNNNNNNNTGTTQSAAGAGVGGDDDDKTTTSIVTAATTTSAATETTTTTTTTTTTPARNDSNKTNDVAVAAAAVPIRRPLWNRGRSNEHQQPSQLLSSQQNSDHTERRGSNNATTTTTTPARRPFWKQLAVVSGGSSNGGGGGDPSNP
eukprot:scaffold12720_cov152-Cylindrotheca_fusiformis.AAC.1